MYRRVQARGANTAERHGAGVRQVDCHGRRLPVGSSSQHLPSENRSVALHDGLDQVRLYVSQKEQSQLFGERGAQTRELRHLRMLDQLRRNSSSLVSLAPRTIHKTVAHFDEQIKLFSDNEDTRFIVGQDAHRFHTLGAHFVCSDLFFVQQCAQRGDRAQRIASNSAVGDHRPRNTRSLHNALPLEKALNQKKNRLSKEVKACLSKLQNGCSDNKAHYKRGIAIPCHLDFDEALERMSDTTVSRRVRRIPGDVDCMRVPHRTTSEFVRQPVLLPKI